MNQFQSTETINIIPNAFRWNIATSIQVNCMHNVHTTHFFGQPVYEHELIIFLDAALVLEPLIGAIAAGNAAMIKPSELAQESASFIAATIPLYLDCKAIKVVNGGADLSDRLLQQKWDKIFFTGIISSFCHIQNISGLSGPLFKGMQPLVFCITTVNTAND